MAAYHAGSRQAIIQFRIDLECFLSGENGIPHTNQSHDSSTMLNSNRVNPWRISRKQHILDMYSN